MALDTAISLTTLAAIKAYLGATPESDALWIYSDGASATAATCEITDTTMVLIITGGTDAGTNTLTFAAAANDTLTELVAVINALSGWKAGLIFHGSASSTDLRTTGALACNTEDNEITLKCASDYLLNDLINRASDFINRYCGRLLKTTSYTHEIYYGAGGSTLILEQYPVTRVSRLAYGRANSFSILNSSSGTNFCTVEITSTTMRLIVSGGTNADDTALTLTDYTSIDALITAIEALSKGWSCTTMATDTSTRDASELLIRPAMNVGSVTRAYLETFDDEITEYRLLAPTTARNYGVIKKPGIFSLSTEYFISYTAGFSTIPYSLEQACIELVKYKYDLSKQTEGLKKEQIGNVYMYEKFSALDLVNGLPAGLKAELEAFMVRDI